MSNVDEDGLGTFQLKGGTESAVTAWYAAFWRRYWYEIHTGMSSKLPAPNGPPPEGNQAKQSIQRLIPLLETACRRADEIARLAGHGPINLSQVKRLQQEQGMKKERIHLIGMSSSATAPITAAFLRQLQSDNVKGLDRLARHHAGAYRTYLSRVLDIQRRLFGAHANDVRLTSDLGSNMPQTGPVQQVA